MNETLQTRVRDLLASMAPDATSALETMRDLYADDMVFHDPMQKIHGIEPFIETNRKLITRSSELQFVVADPVGTDDEFFLTWTMTFRAKLGPAFETDGVTHIRSRDGRVVYHRDHWDLMTLAVSALPGGAAVMRAALRPFV